MSDMGDEIAKTILRAIIIIAGIALVITFVVCCILKQEGLL